MFYMDTMSFLKEKNALDEIKLVMCLASASQEQYIKWRFGFPTSVHKYFPNCTKSRFPTNENLLEGLKYFGVGLPTGVRRGGISHCFSRTNVDKVRASVQFPVLTFMDPDKAHLVSTGFRKFKPEIEESKFFLNESNYSALIREYHKFYLPELFSFDEGKAFVFYMNRVFKLFTDLLPPIRLKCISDIPLCFFDHYEFKFKQKYIRTNVTKGSFANIGTSPYTQDMLQDMCSADEPKIFAILTRFAILTQKIADCYYGPALSSKVYRDVSYRSGPESRPVRLYLWPTFLESIGLLDLESKYALKCDWQHFKYLSYFHPFFVNSLAVHKNFELRMQFTELEIKGFCSAMEVETPNRLGFSAIRNKESYWEARDYLQRKSTLPKKLDEKSIEFLGKCFVAWRNKGHFCSTVSPKTLGYETSSYMDRFTNWLTTNYKPSLVPANQEAFNKERHDIFDIRIMMSVVASQTRKVGDIELKDGTFTKDPATDIEEKKEWVNVKFDQKKEYPLDMAKEYNRIRATDRNGATKVDVPVTPKQAPKEQELKKKEPVIDPIKLKEQELEARLNAEFIKYKINDTTLSKFFAWSNSEDDLENAWFRLENTGFLDRDLPEKYNKLKIFLDSFDDAGRERLLLKYENWVFYV